MRGRSSLGTRTEFVYHIEEFNENEQLIADNPGVHAP